MEAAVPSAPPRPALEGGARAIAVRLLLLAGILAIAALILALLYRALASRGYHFNFGFLQQAAGIEISEGYTIGTVDGALRLVPFVSSQTNAQAILTGCFNTLKIALVAVVASTALGVSVALGRLSTNWLLRQLCFVYVECVRNTPLLIQLVFWYFAVLLKLPPITAAVDLYGVLIASRQGLALPELESGLSAYQAVIAAFAALAMSRLISSALARRGMSAGLGAGMALAVVVAALFAAGFLRLDFPELDRFDITSGIKLSPEWAALFLALTVNTAAYIAEAVRGAILSLPRGQWDAAQALGLSPMAVRRYVILPQVFRIVLPSLGNLYISLAKSTSFGIAIGYPDVFNVYGTIANQTGRTLEGVVLVMLVYLAISWTISAGVNTLNRRLRKGYASP